MPDLLQQLPEYETLVSLTGDGAYDTQPVHETVMRQGAIPIIPLRKNARIRKSSVFEYHNAAIAACRRLGARYLEALEWLSPVEFGENQDELQQTAGRACHVQNL